jgi:chromosome segregation ATPase
MQNELNAALAEATGLRGKLRDAHGDIEAAREAERRTEAARAAEQRDREVLESLVEELNAERARLDGLLAAAYERLEHEADVRGKTLQALEIATALLREAGYAREAQAAEGVAAGD